MRKSRIPAFLSGSVTQSDRGRSASFRAQWSNALIFAPTQRDWVSPVTSCLQRAGG
jgi:hypothetical protein